MPEVFGWAEDGGQIFVYVALVDGNTLMERRESLNDGEKRAIFNELHRLIKLLRTLKQDTHHQDIGMSAGIFILLLGL